MCKGEDPANRKKTKTRRRTQDQIKMDLLIRQIETKPVPSSNT
jgi:hypothetical protein